MIKRILALALCVWVAFLPNLCFAQSSASQGNNSSPSQSGGIRILGSDGTNDYWLQLDSSGRLVTTGAYPAMEVITHKSNITVAAAGIDSSLIPIPVGTYRQIYGLLRMKAMTVGGAMYLSVRGHLAASYDSTAVGWPYPLGLGTRQAKTVGLTTLNDRWKMIPIADSLSGVPFQAPYMSVFLTNLTGAQEIHDFWLLGVR